MWSIVARTLVIATGFSACLATWPNWWASTFRDGQPQLVATATPSGDGILVEDTDQRGGEEERDDDVPAALVGFSTTAQFAQSGVTVADCKGVVPQPRPAHSLGPIRAPPRRA